jgi:putative 4-mercaptohistidine N1-methyltranferase
MSYYETDRALSEYLLFHYGTDEQLLPYEFGPSNALHFPARCVAQCLDQARLGADASALDLGCAVGRSTFELARYCKKALGIDYSCLFITAARQLQQSGRLDFSCVEEGELSSRQTAFVPPEIDRTRVAFQEGDAQALPPDLESFDVVLMANLIDRLRAPQECLRQLPRLVRPGGQLILASPYTWLREFTPRENWLGGFERAGRRIKTLDALKEILSSHFELAGCKDLPFLIREHARKFQWSVAEASMWVRKQ